MQSTDYTTTSPKVQIRKFVMIILHSTICINKMKSLLLLLWTLSVSLVSAQACEERDIRITNQSVTTNGNTFTIAGGLQICVGSQWGTVCQSQWSDSDATVACRQLGLDYADG